MQLISPREASERIGVSVATVKAWIHRAENPLPSVAVGATGKFYKIVADQIDTWLVEEAARKQGTVRESA